MWKTGCIVVLVQGIALPAPCSAAGQDPWSAVFPEADGQPRLVFPGFVSTGDDESHPTPSPDGRTFYYLKNTPSFDFYTIVFTERAAGGWTDPSTVSFSGQYADGDLVFSPDGTHAFFVSFRPVDGVARKDSEIWTVERTASGWGEPRHVAELSSPTDEWFPTLTADGTMYFGSGRNGGLGGSDIWRARRVDGIYQAPENLGAPVNSSGEEIEAFVTPDESLLVIAAKNRGDALGSYDLYLSRREADGWTKPVNPGAPINSPAWELAPRFSPDGALFFFTSNRGFGSKPLKRRLDFDRLISRIRAAGNGLRDIYVLDAAALRKAEPVVGETRGGG